MSARQSGRPPPRAWAVGIARAGTALIDVCAFWLSATTLTDLARRAGIDPMQAWMWPVIVDGMIVVATVAIVALASHGPKATIYAWILLIVGALVSVTANCLHALVAADSDLPPLLATAVAAVPPLVLLAATHLTVQLGQRLPPLPDPSSHQTPPLLEPENSGEPPDEPLPALMDAPEPTGEPESSRQRSTAPAPVLEVSAPARDLRGPGPVRQQADASATEPGEDVSDARAQAMRWAADGLSNRTIAGRLGVHPSTVGRWRAAAPAATDSPVDTPPPPVAEPSTGDAPPRDPPPAESKELS